VLRTPADPVKVFDAELRRLVKDLTDTMLEAPGVGLAAPQIGVSLRVFTFHVDDQVGHLINPTLSLSAEEETDEEGCLSFPGLVYPTKRAYGVVAKGFNMHGEPDTLEGTWPAGQVRAARDRSPGRRAVHRPAGPGAAQAGDEGDPRVRLVEGRRSQGEDLTAPHLGQGALSGMRDGFAMTRSAGPGGRPAGPC